MNRERAKARSLYCACCGAWTKGRQWPNRDTGYGVCRRCFKMVAKKEGFSQARWLYGRPGTHHSLPGEP